MHNSDTELIAQIRKGTETAFDDLMQRYREPVYRTAYSFAREKESALDITQNVFIKVYRNLDRFRGDSQVKTWIMRIAMNESTNWLRSNRRHSGHSELDQIPALPANEISAEDELLARDNHTALLRSLYQLNSRYRLAVVLRYFENYSMREIAAVLDTSEGTVKSMIFRSLQKLKTILAESEQS